MQTIKEIRRRGARRDLNGPRTNSEEPNLSGRDDIGLRRPNPTPFSIGTPLKSGSEHRPATKPKLFKPTLYKSYCEGTFMCEPKNINGPQRNRVLTIIIDVCLARDDMLKSNLGTLWYQYPKNHRLSYYMDEPLSI